MSYQLDPKARKAFSLVVRDTGMLPENVMKLKFRDVNLDKGIVNSNYPGCEICEEIFPQDRVIYLAHTQSEKHIQKVAEELDRFFLS